MAMLTSLLESAKLIARRMPYVRRYRELPAWQVCRHRYALAFQPRENSTFTGFLRLPTQFEALEGPVIHFLAKEPRSAPLRIVVVGCSNGAEAYTIASRLMAASSGIEFQIDAYDINSNILEKARSACFQVEEVLNNKIITSEFIRSTFEVAHDIYRVKKNVAAKVRFFLADALSPNLAGQAGSCDILFAQNFLFHLNREDAVRAFENLCGLLKPRAALFIDGMDLDLRRKLTRKRDLVPLDFRIEEIHNEARRARAAGWPDHYWGLEPFKMFTSDWQRRYATIFFNDATRSLGPESHQ